MISHGLNGFAPACIHFRAPPILRPLAILEIRGQMLLEDPQVSPGGVRWQELLDPGGQTMEWT
jgi:hypothetical protein